MAEDHGLDGELLQAVIDEVLAYGVRRATATSIAARAGVSRVTLYRRGGGVRQLILDALSGEFARTLRDVVAATPAEATGRAQVVHLCTRGVEALSSAPLTHALLRHDPELLLPYVVDRFGHSQTGVLTALQAAIERGSADGTIRDADPGLLALVLMQSLTPFVVSVHLATAHVAPGDLQAEITCLVDQYLAPATPTGRRAR